MGKQITPTEAKKLCNNFDEKYTALKTLIGKDDNRSNLFSIAELKEYISYLENADGNIDGIRIYSGSYASSALSTVFLAPTSLGKDNTKLDVFNMAIDGNPLGKKYGN